jgi:hypothetical protein
MTFSLILSRLQSVSAECESCYTPIHLSGDLLLIGGSAGIYRKPRILNHADATMHADSPFVITTVLPLQIFWFLKKTPQQLQVRQSPTTETLEKLLDR